MNHEAAVRALDARLESPEAPELDGELRRHLDGCEECARSWAAYAGIEHAFRHPSGHAIAAIALGASLPEGETAERVHGHLELCPSCASELESVRSVEASDPSIEVVAAPTVTVAGRWRTAGRWLAAVAAGLVVGVAVGAALRPSAPPSAAPSAWVGLVSPGRLETVRGAGEVTVHPLQSVVELVAVVDGASLAMIDAEPGATFSWTLSDASDATLWSQQLDGATLRALLVQDPEAAVHLQVARSLLSEGIHDLMLSRLDVDGSEELLWSSRFRVVVSASPRSR